MSTLLFAAFPSKFEEFTIVWKEVNSKTKIARIFLSDTKMNAEAKTMEAFNIIRKSLSELIDSIGKSIQQFLEGKEIQFDLQLLDFTQCSVTQEKVLRAEYNIPRGWISTYKRIAQHIGIKNGARVVGNSLARNPFPIFIPCHRAIRTNGELGGYQGGLDMKRKLLEFEGITFSSNVRVNTKKIYY